MAAHVLYSSFRCATPGLRALAAAFRDHEPRFTALGLLLLALMLPTGFAAAVDPREFLGVDIWVKPLKFELAIATYVLTLAFFARFVPAEVRAKRWYRAYIGAVVAAVVLEIIWIGGAAALGTASHFNESVIGVVIYAVMGAGAVLLTSASTVYAVQIARNTKPEIGSALKEALVLGLALVLPLTLLSAGTMSSMDGHWIGGQPSDAGGMALMGWARDGGDLRVSHFFATHAMHFIPAFGLVSATFFGAENRLPVRIFGLLFTAFVLYTFVQALMGQPFLAMVG
ncbi:hypothetical protein L861_16470 [Litchfieldella anticariensis FP35 = DSM 16096]|uniref:Uncharacterized protein n=1 Tax=Litchfieldella anticariensis (strain DSM 16096 / CECT 5854 / CIP 108499 / LMG 22089 / FP35) TaxID=1121939 RepID=S2KHJ8_LITA3|nr:hypothetical protein [Halomonas anticariensis]EPC01612.1 hypothetical protein L861_16470 [Halomonas anticariensis FP35 = DSM 16096]